MNLSREKIIELYKKIKDSRPIVHCITNEVTVNDCANILLAAGASPTMAHHPLEVEEITQGADALVCNMGAVGDFEAMVRAGRRAHELGHPIVVDPVGVGGSGFRREKCIELIREIHPTCVRGNYSEIQALIENKNTVTGVDAAFGNTRQMQEKLTADMEKYAALQKAIVIASGETDIITDGSRTAYCRNGDLLMTQITGSGCMSSAMLGAFLSVEPCIAGAAAAVAFVGIAGELAAERTRAQHGGTMTFHDCFIDAVSLAGDREIWDNKLHFTL